MADVSVGAFTGASVGVIAGVGANGGAGAGLLILTLQTIIDPKFYNSCLFSQVSCRIRPSVST